MPGGAKRVFDLEQPRTENGCRSTLPTGRRVTPTSCTATTRTIPSREAGPRTGAAGVLICGEHTGTHIDALCHQSDALMLCGGVPVGEVQSPRGFTRHGVEEIPPIAAPGVLLDVAAKDGVESLDPAASLRPLI